MMGIEEIRNDLEIKNAIDWEMTPEEAVTRYLEWGNNWSHGKDLVRSKNDVSYYFVVSTWDDPASVYFIRRNSEEAVELAKIPLPEELWNHVLEWTGHNKGVYALTDEIRAWLEKEIYRISG